MKTNNRQLQSTVLLTLCLMVLLLGGCRERGGQETPPEEVAVTAIPTATAVTVSAIPTFTPTNVPDTPTPTSVPTHTPIPPPTAVPTVEDKRATVNSPYGANLRAGPSITYATVGFLEQGKKVTAIAQTRNGRWIQLENGWVFHNLLDGIPADLPLPQSIPSPPTPTPLPPTATATPAPSTPTLAPTPSPFPYTYEPDELEDGLRIKLTKTIHADEEDAMQTYIETTVDQNCRGCLALELEIRNVAGLETERVAQEDFKLVKIGDTVIEHSPVPCDSPRNLLPSAPLKISINRPATTVHLCFKGIEDSKWDIIETYRLAYSHKFIWTPPTATPGPTPTPRSRKHEYVTPEPPNEEKRRGWAWTYHFRLGSE